MEMRKRVLGQEHPDTLASMNNLASMRKALGRNNKALELIENCLRLRKQRLGLDHSDTISSLKALNEWQMENWREVPSVICVAGKLSNVSVMLRLPARSQMSCYIKRVLAVEVQ